MSWSMVFEGLNDADYIFNSDLVATQMKGYANGTGYREIVRRKGANKFHGRDTSFEKLKYMSRINGRFLKKKL